MARPCSLGLLSGNASNGRPRNRITRIRAKAQPAWLSHTTRGRGALKKLDQDNDGRISRSEWQRNEQAFDRLDADKDGFLTKEELRLAVREFRGKHRNGLQKMDADADGNISRSEWKGKEEIFNRLDANNDRVLTRDELRQARKQRRSGSHRLDQGDKTTL